MIKAIIIEDEQKAAQLLELMLTNIDNTVMVIDKCKDLPTGVKSIKKNNPDIVFLDIEMPGYSGLQLLEFFNEEEVNFSIVFTTAFNDYAIKAFELSAIDYLLKPLQEDKLQNALEKFKRLKNHHSAKNLSVLKNNLNNNLSRKIAIPVANGLEIVKLQDLNYFQAEGSYTKIFLRNQTPILVSKKLKYFEDLLEEDPSFIRCHRSYIVNIHSIKKYVKSDGGMLVIEDGSELPISVDKTEEILTLLSKYL
ncbi:MAG: LytR/AlgR family response regulator transcription factor [Chitinophagaceae bacterium]